MLNLENFQEPHFLFWVFGFLCFAILVQFEVKHRKRKKEMEKDEESSP